MQKCSFSPNITGGSLLLHPWDLFFGVSHQFEEKKIDLQSASCETEFWLKNEPKTDKLDKRLEASRERGPLWVKAVLADPFRWWRVSPLLGSQQILTISKSAAAFPTCLVKFKSKRNIQNFLSSIPMVWKSDHRWRESWKRRRKCNFLFNPSNDSRCMIVLLSGKICKIFHIMNVSGNSALCSTFL